MHVVCQLWYGRHIICVVSADGVVSQCNQMFDDVRDILCVYPLACVGVFVFRKRSFQ